MGYPKDEQETTCVYDAALGRWMVYSTFRKHINKLLKQAGEPYWKEAETGETGIVYVIAGKWHLTYRQVSFLGVAKPSKPQEGHAGASYNVPAGMLDGLTEGRVENE